MIRNKQSPASTISVLDLRITHQSSRVQTLMLDGARHGQGSDTTRHNAVVILLHAATTVMAAAFCLSTARVTKRGTGDCFIEISQAGQRCEACCFAPPFPPSDPEQIYPDQGGGPLLSRCFAPFPFFMCWTTKNASQDRVRPDQTRAHLMGGQA